MNVSASRFASTSQSPPEFQYPCISSTVCRTHWSTYSSLSDLFHGRSFLNPCDSGVAFNFCTSVISYSLQNIWYFRKIFIASGDRLCVALRPGLVYHNKLHIKGSAVLFIVFPVNRDVRTDIIILPQLIPVLTVGFICHASAENGNKPSAVAQPRKRLIYMPLRV